MSKQYGLILRTQKRTPPQVARSSVFDDSSDEDDNVRSQVNTSITKEGKRKLEAKTTRTTLLQALSEDPTVFEYDTVYDDIKETKIQSQAKLASTKDRKPRYISALKKAAEVRKMEQDIIFERQVQKELACDGDMYSDKEAYVTPAFKRKLQEQAEMKKRLKKEEEIDAVNDVTKQQDMGLFYRHLLTQQIDSDKVTMSNKKKPDYPTTTTTASGENRLTTNEGTDLSTEGVDVGDEDSLSPSDDTHNKAPPHEDGSSSVANSEPTEPVPISKEERIRIAAAKRTTEDSLMSARERYMARKKAKISQPVIQSDDDDY